MFDFITMGDATIDAFLGIHDASVHCRLDEKTCELCVKYGDKIPVDSCEFSLGGDACNVAVGLSRLGLKTALCAELGDDEFALKIHNGLGKEKIDKRLLRTSQAETTFAIALNFQHERTLFVQHVKREHKFSFENVTSKWMYLTSLGDTWEHAYDAAMRFVEKHAISLVFAPGTKQLDAGYHKLKPFLENTDILILNKEEGEKLANSKWLITKSQMQIKDLLARLQSLGPKTVVVTDGRHGSYLLEEQGNVHVQRVFPHKIVERTGAGDAYASGFLAAHFLGTDWQEAMRWGTTNAGSVVEHIGAQKGLLKRGEMEERLKITQ